MHPGLKPVVDRWGIFLGKVRGRLQEVLTEADGAYEEVIQIEVVDPAAISGVTSALQGRIHGLASKVQDSWEKIDEELSAASDAADVPPDEYARVRAEQQTLGRELEREINLQGELLTINKESKLARALGEAAKLELKDALRCQNCGADVKPELYHQASNARCPHCQAVSTITPGMATAMYFGGGAVHNLAREASLREWLAMGEAERRFQGLRHPTEDDLKQYEAATATYWRAYCFAFGKHHPGWNDATVEADFRGKMGHFHEYVAGNDKETRARMTDALRVVATGDGRSFGQWLKTNRPGDEASYLEEVILAAAEHGDLRGVSMLVEVLYALERPDEPKSQWTREKLAEVNRWMVTR